MELNAGNSTNINMMLNDRAQPRHTLSDNGHITQEHEQLELTTFENSESSTLDIEQDIDPDNNFFSTINNTCYYYNNDQYNGNIIAKDKLSIKEILLSVVYIELQVLACISSGNGWKTW